MAERKPDMDEHIGDVNEDEVIGVDEDDDFDDDDDDDDDFDDDDEAEGE
jgi:hypothetical protein